MSQGLLLCGVILGPFFIAVFLIEGSIRKGYYPLRQPVSALAIGPRGWIQKINFFITGTLAIALAFGSHAALEPFGGSFWLPTLIGLYGFGLIGAGIFVTDVTGLPEDTAWRGKRPISGVLHDLFALPVFAGLCAACLLSVSLFIHVNQWGWALYSALSGILMAVFFVFAGAGFSGSPRFASYGGMWQRFSICVGWIWLSLFALFLR